eukprot:SAG11_NODE_2031_length_3901_cov_3.995792_2_plen_609_part_00
MLYKSAVDASPTVAEQFAHAGYDWLLVDCQHGPMDSITLSAMLCAISSGGAKSMVRVAGYDDRSGIQQALDLGADGILIPYINTAAEAAAGVSCCLYPSAGALGPRMEGTRSVYFPQRSMNKAGLLGYAGAQNDNVLIALQVETAECIANMREICNVPRVDMLFLGQNDLCMSMGLFGGQYKFPEMYQSEELQAATRTLIKEAKRAGILLGMFQFGTDRVAEFLEQDFNFISVGNDLHHCLTQNFAHIERLVECSAQAGKPWSPRQCAMPYGLPGAVGAACVEGFAPAHNPGAQATGRPGTTTMKDFKTDLVKSPKFGAFINSHSPTVAEQFAHAGYDWLLVDCQHGPMDSITLSAMLCAISSGGAKSMVRVAGYDDRSGIQQALDLGADGILIPYINTAAEAAAGVSCCLYPSAGALGPRMEGTRSVYFPQRSMNKAGLLGYAGALNDIVLIALQDEPAECIANMREICNVPRVDMLFLGQNDLCMSMGLFGGQYKFPEMYQSEELQAATRTLIKEAKRAGILLGMFQFGTDRVAEFLEQDFNFISVGNDLHHCLTQNFAHIERLVECSAQAGKPWSPRQCAMPYGLPGAVGAACVEGFAPAHNPGA